MKPAYIVLLALVCACQKPAPSATPDGGSSCVVTTPAPTAPVNGWILMSPDPTSIRASIEAAARYGVNHIQISHDLIMNVDELLGDGPEVEARVTSVNLAIQLAHEHGMKAYIWAHEFSGAGPDICFDPADPVWAQRKEAYLNGLAKIPGVDGVILQFGSAPLPPWVAFCLCDWCVQNYPDVSPLAAPPPANRMRMITERIGGYIANELHKEVVARTFVHEPDEIAWHQEAYTAACGVPFVGMHKSDVQDWQPYNPPDTGMGNNGEHSGLMEMDVAGEYYGLSILPFCSPEYFQYRLKYGVDHKVIGTAVRMQRGDRTALGTPNEVNLLGVSDWLLHRDRPVSETWNTFISSTYGVTPDNAVQPVLKRLLADTFAIRLKAHYVLGIWAMEKSSDIPDSTELSQFDGRGKMPKWAPEWQGVWDDLNEPDRGVVERVWQEASEGVELATEDAQALPQLESVLTGEKYADLRRRWTHQRLASETWRDVKLFIWAQRALGSRAAGDAPLKAWSAWALQDLTRIAGEMEAAGLANAELASPSRIRSFVSKTQGMVPGGTDAERPPDANFSAVRTTALSATSVTLHFSTRQDARVSLEYGTELPNQSALKDLGPLQVGAHEIAVSELTPGQRYIFRLRTGGQLSGYHWVFTPDR